MHALNFSSISVNCTNIIPFIYIYLWNNIPSGRGIVKGASLKSLFHLLINNHANKKDYNLIGKKRLEIWVEIINVCKEKKKYF